MSSPRPRQPVPALDLTTLDGGNWQLADQAPDNFTMVVFYRGLHCPLCKGQLSNLDQRLGEFTDRGVEVIAVSTDTVERAEATPDAWGLEKLRIAHGLSVDEARKWGLYISTSRGKTSVGIEEPDMFNEPGLFLIKPDGTLFGAYVQTMPFGRPEIDGVLKAIDFAIERQYPPRGHA